MKRRKLFYVPGMLSLLVVPVLLYLYQPTIKKQTCIRLFVPTDRKPMEGTDYFSRYAVMDHIKRKKVNTVYLDDDHSLNNTKLNFIGQETLRLKFYNDTTQVIKVHLDDEVTYNDFIQLMNVMLISEQKRYALIDNDLYIFGEAPPDPPGIKIQTWVCGFEPIVKVKTWKEKTLMWLNNSWSLITNNALLLSAFALLIIVPVLIKLKRGM